MLETSTNGAGAAAEAATASREDQGGVAELGFGAGVRAAPAGVPDPELVAQAKRRSFTAKILADDGGHGKLPMGGHRISPVVATVSPHGWPRFLPMVLS